MAVLRRQNILGQQRLDAPHLRSIESGVAADFDVLAGIILAGGESFIVKGFNILPDGMIGASASQLMVNMADSAMLHYNGTESGTIYSTPADSTEETLNSVSNPNVQGSFQASSTNYIGIDFVAEADSSTDDLVQFLDADTDTETAKTVPLARTLKTVIYISQTPFDASSTVNPIATVVTSASNTVVSIQDARKLVFRLGTGGNNVDTEHVYPWPQGRSEDTDPATDDTTVGGDKAISSFKDWADAVMTTLWEVKGGTNWFSPTSDRGVKLVRDPSNPGGDNFSWTAPTLTWAGLKIVFENSGGAVYFNDISDGSASLPAAGYCLYVDIDRSRNMLASGTPVYAQVGYLPTLSMPAIPGSRYILAWRVDYAGPVSRVFTRDFPYYVGQVFTSATPTVTGVVRVNTNDASPEAATINASHSVRGAGITRDGAYAQDGSGLIGVGTLKVGDGTNDSAVELGKLGATVTAKGTLAAVTKVTAPTFDTTVAAAMNVGTTNATSVVLGKSSVGTSVVGNLSIKGILDTLTATNMSIGVTNATLITIGRSGQTTAIDSDALILGGSTIDVGPAGSTFNIGRTYAGDISFGRAGFNTINHSDESRDLTHVVEGALYPDNGAGAADANKRITYPVFGELSDPNNSTLSGVAAGFFFNTLGQSRNLTLGAGGFSAVPAGMYQLSLQTTLKITALGGGASSTGSIYFRSYVGYDGNVTHSGANVTMTLDTDPGLTVGDSITYSPSAGAIAAGYVAGTFTLIAGTSGATLKWTQGGAPTGNATPGGSIRIMRGVCLVSPQNTSTGFAINTAYSVGYTTLIDVVSSASAFVIWDIVTSSAKSLDVTFDSANTVLTRIAPH